MRVSWRCACKNLSLPLLALLLLLLSVSLYQRHCASLLNLKQPVGNALRVPGRVERRRGKQRTRAMDEEQQSE